MDIKGRKPNYKYSPGDILWYYNNKSKPCQVEIIDYYEDLHYSIEESYIISPTNSDNYEESIIICGEQNLHLTKDLITHLTKQTSSILCWINEIVFKQGLDHPANN